MGVVNPEWVQAADRILTRTGYLPIEKMAAAVVAELEPLIRADERERIAQEIEAKARGQWTLGTDWVTIAARIARGGESDE